jgi:hypothetical protein
MALNYANLMPDHGSSDADPGSAPEHGVKDLSRSLCHEGISVHKQPILTLAPGFQKRAILVPYPLAPHDRFLTPNPRQSIACVGGPDGVALFPPVRDIAVGATERE